MHLETSYPGIYRGIVKDNNDPKNLGRLRLIVPQIFGEEITTWAWANYRPGIANVPVPEGAAVWVMFEGGDPNFPVWVGMSSEQVTGVPVPITGDLIPNADDTYLIGSATKRWKSIFLGPGTVNITDSVLGTNATIGVANGVFFINGIAQAQLPNLKVTNLTFNDNTVQTTALHSGASTSYTPTFGDGATYAQSSNGATGGYIKNGKLVYFDVEFPFTHVTNFGTTQYHITLPFTAAKEAVFRNGTFHDSSANNTYHITGHVAAGSNVMDLYYTTAGQDQFFDHNSPVTIQTVDSFHLSGMYEAQ
jgi:hypothetical protein